MPRADGPRERKSMTKREQLIKGLEAEGWTRDQWDRSRYDAFVHPQVQGRKMFVGENGALRTGHCASESVSLSHTGKYADLMAKGKVTEVKKPNLAELFKA